MNESGQDPSGQLVDHVQALDTGGDQSSPPPLAVDIDGTLTDGNRAVDPRVCQVLREWPTPVVVSTGKAIPYPVALCEFLGIEPLVVAENGGVVLADRTDTFHVEGDRSAVDRVAAAYRDAGHDLGWSESNLVNRWRESELAVSRTQPLEPLTEIAAEHGLEVLDTGYAYHVKPTGFNKGTGLTRIAAELDIEPSEFAAIGDSENDAPTFERVGTAIAVRNADETALAAADHVTDARYGAGFLEAVKHLLTA